MACQELKASGTATEEVSTPERKRRRLTSALSASPRQDSQNPCNPLEQQAGSSAGPTEQLRPRDYEQLARSSRSTSGDADLLQLGHGQPGSRDPDVPDESPEEEAFPSDTMVALKLMISQFPKIIEKVAVRPFVLRSQLYSSLKDRTEVDRELERLRRRYEVRMFKLNTGQDDYALMLMNDYMIQVNAAEERMKAKRSEPDVVVFEWFKAYVLRSNCEVTSLSQGGKVKDKQVSLLINAGLLVRQLANDTSYWFSIPNVGFLLKNLTEGRKELLSFINRRRYKEVLQAELERRKLRYSQLDMRFHLRDLLGSGKLQSVETTVGPLIRASRD